MKRFILFTVLLTALACGDEPYVEVGGSRITESDLESDYPRVYSQLQAEYNEMVMQQLEGMGKEKLFELEAEEQGMEDAREYIEHLRSQVPEPSEEEILTAYLGYRSAGRIPAGTGLDEVRQQIRAQIFNTRFQSAMQTEQRRLEDKFDYQAYYGPCPDTSEEDRVELASHEDDPVRLNPDGEVTIVEFSDFDCFYCRKVQPTTERLREKYGDRLRWIVKDFPLDQIHPRARGAHIAANCVLKQDEAMYWEFFDTIYAEGGDDPSIFAPDNLAGLAESLGANMGAYNQCINDPAINEEINRDVQQGAEVGVSGTPAIFINGVLYSGAQPFPKFDQAIRCELQ